MRKTVQTLLALLLLSALAAPIGLFPGPKPVIASPDNTFYIPQSPVPGLSPGSTFSVTINVDALPRPLTAYVASMRYDTTVLTATAITFVGTDFDTQCAAPACSEFQLRNVVDDIGAFVVIDVSYLGGQMNTAGSLARVDFRVDAAGTSPLDLCHDVDGDGLLDCAVVDDTFTDVFAGALDGVYSQPPPSQLSVDFSVSPSIIFKTEPVTFTASVTGGQAPYTYSWDALLNGVIDSTDSTMTFTFLSKGPRSVGLTVMDADGTTVTVVKTFTVWNEPKFAALKWTVDSDGDGIKDSFFAKFKVLAPFDPPLTTDIQLHIVVTDATTGMPAGCLDAFYPNVPQRVAVIVSINPNDPANACGTGPTFTPQSGVEYAFVGTLIYTTLDATGVSDFVKTGSFVA